MAEALLRHHAGDRFEAYSAGCSPSDEIHPYAKRVMEEVGIDVSDQHPEGLRTYMGKVGFNYSTIVCARAEKDCPKTFPGVGTRLVWIFDDPRAEDVPEEEMLNTFREVRDEIEQRILDWLEHPEEELARLKEEREQERRERLEAARREASSLGVFAVAEADRGLRGKTLGVAQASQNSAGLVVRRFALLMGLSARDVLASCRAFGQLGAGLLRALGRGEEFKLPHPFKAVL